MTPIPKYLLCHSAVLTVHYGPDQWGKAGKSVSSPLECVRTEPTLKNIRTVNQAEITLTARLFFDVHNSRCGLPFMLSGDSHDGEAVTAETVEFNGRTYNVETISPVYDARALHHYEVGLSGG